METNPPAAMRYAPVVERIGGRTVRFVHDIAHDNRQAGFFIGYSPNANATVSGTRARSTSLPAKTTLHRPCWIAWRRI